MATEAQSKETFKFPAFQPDLLPTHEEEPYGLTARTPSPSRNQQLPHTNTPDRWQPRREQRTGYANGSVHGANTRHGRQKSLSEALRTIRTRKASVSQNAHEIADALKAPVSPRLIVRLANADTNWRIADRRRRSVVFGT